jgi:hypothetical protein
MKLKNPDLSDEDVAYINSKVDSTMSEYLDKVKAIV